MPTHEIENSCLRSASPDFLDEEFMRLGFRFIHRKSGLGMRWLAITEVASVLNVTVTEVISETLKLGAMSMLRGKITGEKDNFCFSEFYVAEYHFFVLAFFCGGSAVEDIRSWIIDRAAPSVLVPKLTELASATRGHVAVSGASGAAVGMTEEAVLLD